LKIPNSVTAVIVKAPYVAYVNPTGIIVIAFEIQKIQTTILTTQKIVGFIFENPSVVFKNPFATMPVIIAKIK
jgi:uncharacterized protein with ATP-grasp and redox domains